MAPSVELSKRLFAFTSLCGALSTDRATPFHGKSMENVSGRREWRGAERENDEGHIADVAVVVMVLRAVYKVSLPSRIHKESCFLFQLGETLNPELQIITSVFSKVIHRGEYKIRRKGKRKTLLLRSFPKSSWKLRRHPWLLIA